MRKIKLFNKKQVYNEPSNFDLWSGEYIIPNRMMKEWLPMKKYRNVLGGNPKPSPLPYSFKQLLKETPMKNITMYQVPVGAVIPARTYWYESGPAGQFTTNIWDGVTYQIAEDPIRYTLDQLFPEPSPLPTGLGAIISASQEYFVLADPEGDTPWLRMIDDEWWTEKEILDTGLCFEVLFEGIKDW